MTARGTPTMYIANDRARRQTFNTLVRGLETKARALSTLCGVDVSVHVVNGGEIRRTAWKGEREPRRTDAGRGGPASEDEGPSAQGGAAVAGSCCGGGIDGAIGPVEEPSVGMLRAGQLVPGVLGPVGISPGVCHRDTPVVEEPAYRLPTPQIMASRSPEQTPPPLPPRGASLTAAGTPSPRPASAHLSDTHKNEYHSHEPSPAPNPIQHDLSMPLCPVELCHTYGCPPPQCRDCPMPAPAAPPRTHPPHAESSSNHRSTTGVDPSRWTQATRFTEGFPHPAVARGTVALELPPHSTISQQLGAPRVWAESTWRPALFEREGGTPEPGGVFEPRARSPGTIRRLGGGVAKRRSQRLAGSEGRDS